MRRRLAPAVVLLALASAAPAQQVLFTVFGDSATDAFGQVVDIVGDANGDGRADVIVGAWRDDPGGKMDAGTVRLVSGADGSTLLTIPGDLANDHMGFGSSGVGGDLNGDGLADFVAAADEADQPGKSNVGTAKVISGADGTTIWFLVGVNPGDFFGWSSAAAGDVDADGTLDVVLGALNGDTATTNATGSATVVSGATGLTLWTVFGDGGGDQLGYSVAGVGDLNADGHGDFFAGAPMDDDDGTDSGSARLYSGSDGSTLHTFLGDSVADLFGRSVAGIGDVDADGIPDLAVGAPQDDNAGTNSGSVRVFSGATFAALTTLNGTASSRFGTWVRGAGDVDGDGRPDIVVGAPNTVFGGATVGSMRVFRGSNFALIHTFLGDGSGDTFGTSVAGGGDLDGDGFPDLVAGAPGDDDNGTGSGSARAFSPTWIGVSHFGSGTPGCAGTQHLDANGLPQVGNAAFALLGDHAPPSSLELVLAANIADLPGSDPFGFGVVFHVNFSSSLLLAFDGASDASGSMVAPVPIPNVPSFAGAVIHFQSISVWSPPCAGLGPLGLSSSIGMSATLQP